MIRSIFFKEWLKTRMAVALAYVASMGLCTSKATDSAYERAKKRLPFRRRAGIEPHFSHLKSDFRMRENYLHGKDSSTINAMLAATAWNLKKTMRKLKSLFDFFVQMLRRHFDTPHTIIPYAI